MSSVLSDFIPVQGAQLEGADEVQGLRLQGQERRGDQASVILNQKMYFHF